MLIEYIVNSNDYFINLPAIVAMELEFFAEYHFCMYHHTSTLFSIGVLYIEISQLCA